MHDNAKKKMQMKKISIDLHTHTVASSHAFSTITENAHIAAQKDLQIIACTDHGPELPGGANKIFFKSQRCIPRFIEGVGILRGIEANIDDNGKIDCTPSMMDYLDIVMAGFHAPVYSDARFENHNTEMMIRVIASGKVDVITHPANINYPINLKAVVKAARKHNVALELNASPYTRTNSRTMAVELVKTAANAGVHLVMGSDAHICFDVGRFDLGYEILDEAGTGSEYLLNSDPVRLLSFLKSRGHDSVDDFISHFSEKGSV